MTVRNEGYCRFRNKKRCLLFRSPYHPSIPSSSDVFLCELADFASPEADSIVAQRNYCPLTMIDNDYPFELAAKDFLLTIAQMGNQENDTEFS